MDYYPPGSSVRGILQAWILEWVATPFSRGSSRPRDWTWVSSITGRFFMRHQGSLAIEERRTKYLLSLLPLLLSMAIWHGSGQWSISRHLPGPSGETFVFLDDTEKHTLCHSCAPSSYLQFRCGGWSQSSLFVPLKEQCRKGQENCIAAGPGQARPLDNPQQLLKLEFLDIWNKFCLFDTDFFEFSHVWFKAFLSATKTPHYRLTV